MSIDTAWSANTLQKPVHSHLSKVAQHLYDVTGGTTPGGYNPLHLNRPLPTQGPQARLAQARLAFERQIMMGQPGTVQGPLHQGIFGGGLDMNFISQQAAKQAQNKPAGGGPIDMNFISQQAARQAQRKPAGGAVQPIAQPGVDPSITTKIPSAPSDGIPQLPQISGWTAPGRNFSISQVT